MILDFTRLNYYCDEQAPLVDAYSLGRLLRYMLTGVPPDKSVMDALEEQSGMIGACFCLGFGGKSSGKSKRIIEPRFASPRLSRDQPRSCAEIMRRDHARFAEIMRRARDAAERCAERRVATYRGRYLSADARDLMARLTEADPGKRLGVSDARNHAWMSCKAE